MLYLVFPLHSHGAHHHEALVVVGNWSYFHLTESSVQLLIFAQLSHACVQYQDASEGAEI